MKRRSAVVLCVVMLLAALSACGDDEAGITATTQDLATAETTITTQATTTTTQATTTTTTQVTTTTVFDPDWVLGAWLLESGDSPRVFTFSDDGTYTMHYAVNGYIGEVGQYSFEGTRISLEAMPDALTGEQFGNECSEEPGLYEVSVADDGNALSLAWVSDSCARRSDLVFGLTRYDPET